MPEREKIIQGLQSRYNAHRAPELAETRELSLHFFERWRSEGLVLAFLYFHDQQKTMGSRYIPTPVKTVFNLTGSTFLALGIRDVIRPIAKAAELNNPTISSVQKRFGELFWTLTLRFLFDEIEATPADKNS